MRSEAVWRLRIRFIAVLEKRVVEFVSTIAMCDSCFVYVLEGEEAALRASKNPHADLVDGLTCHSARELPAGSPCTNSRWRLAPRRGAIRGSRCSMICLKTILRRFSPCPFFAEESSWG